MYLHSVQNTHCTCQRVILPLGVPPISNATTAESAGDGRGGSNTVIIVQRAIVDQEQRGVEYYIKRIIIVITIIVENGYVVGRGKLCTLCVPTYSFHIHCTVHRIQQRNGPSSKRMLIRNGDQNRNQGYESKLRIKYVV